MNRDTFNEASKYLGEAESCNKAIKDIISLNEDYYIHVMTFVTLKYLCKDDNELSKAIVGLLEAKRDKALDNFNKVK